MSLLPASDPRRIALESDFTLVNILLTLRIGADVRRYTDAGRDITIGGNTYSPNGAIRAADTPKTSAAPDADVMELLFLDGYKSAQDYETLFTAGGYNRVQLELDVLFWRAGAGPTVPLAVFRGRCIGVSTAFDDSQGRVTRVRFASKLHRGGARIGIVTSDWQQRQRRRTDGSCRYAAIGRDIPWGRQVEKDALSGSGSGVPTGPSR